MIIIRTPYRISFFGGGTDYPAWFEEHGGAVISTTIDKYCWITIRPLPRFFSHHSRLVWSEIELVKDMSEMKHPAAKACCELLGVKDVEVHCDGELPAGSGVGSSSTFVVCFLQALHALRGDIVSRETLALEAMHVEIDMLGESVGCQDQVAAAFGGFNHIAFFTERMERRFSVARISMSVSFAHRLQNHLTLFFTSHQRSASGIASAQIQNIPAKAPELSALATLTKSAYSAIQDEDMGLFAALLRDSWAIKRDLSPMVTNERIDSLHDAVMGAGALGCKLVGAGGGGFLLVLRDPRLRYTIAEAIPDCLPVDFTFDNFGSSVLLR